MALLPSKKSSKDDYDADLNITSLMDAFTIILVFLVKQFGSNVIEVAEGYKLPESETRLTVDRVMTLQVRELGQDIIAYRIADEQQEKIERKNANGTYSQLLDDLKEHKDLVDAVITDEELKGAINIVGDHQIRYQTVVDVMMVAARSGFYKLNLVAEPAG